MTSTGTRVRYHGTYTQVHGLYQVDGTCTCVDCDNDHDRWGILARNHQANPALYPAPGPEPVRYVLKPTVPGMGRVDHLEHVRPESFTPAGGED